MKKPANYYHFNEETTQQALERANFKCEVPDCKTPHDLDSPHHAIPKSKYFGKDRSELWNCFIICKYHHRLIHHCSDNKEDVEERRRIVPLVREVAKKRYNKY